MKLRSLIVAKLVVPLLTLYVFAGDVSMHLMTHDVGWTLHSAHLFWTNDGGTHWRNITPGSGASLDDVFFLDATQGWTLLVTPERGDLVGISIASTSDAGKTWSISPIKVKQGPDELNGRGWLDFIDPLHGWLVLHGNSSSALSWGRMMTTEDGGKTWRELPQVPIAGRPVFISLLDGWIAGNGGGGGVYRTRDGGKTWDGAGPRIEDLPTTLPTRAGFGDVQFTDPKHGFIPVSLTEASEAEKSRGTALVLFATGDGGDTWQLNRVLSDRSFKQTGAPLARFGPTSLVVASAENEILIATFNESTSGRLTLKTVDADRKVAVSSSDHVLAEHEWPVSVSFVTTTSGWLRTSNGRLLATDNGGATWKDISPMLSDNRTTSSWGVRKKNIRFGAAELGVGPSLVPQSPTAGLHYSQRLGFDEHNVPSIAR